MLTVRGKDHLEDGAVLDNSLRFLVHMGSSKRLRKSVVNVKVRRR